MFIFVPIEMSRDDNVEAVAHSTHHVVSLSSDYRMVGCSPHHIEMNYRNEF